MFATLKTCLILCPPISIWIRLTRFDSSNRWRLDRCSSCSQIELVSVVLGCRKLSVVVGFGSGAVVGCRCSGGRKKNFAGIAVDSRLTVFCVCHMRTANSVAVMSTGPDGMVTRIDWSWSSGLKTFEMVKGLPHSAVHVRSSVCFLVVRLRTRCRGLMIDIDCRCVRRHATIIDLFSIRFFRVMLKEWLPHQALALLLVRPSSQLRLSHRVLSELVARHTVWLMVSDLSWWRRASCYRWKRLSCCRWWLVAYVEQLHKCPPIHRVSVFDSRLRITSWIFVSGVGSYRCLNLSMSWEAIGFNAIRERLIP